jgi:drug/metabolite transporter (DMT)-like permease
MPLGLLTGLGAALSWGTMDIASALATRRIGSLLVTAGVQVIGAVLLFAIAALLGTAFPTDPVVIVGGALVGLAGAGAYLSYFTGLRYGPISVVSGMVAAYGGLTVLLAVIVRGETLSPLQAIGTTVATIGVVMTGVAFDGGLRGARFAGPGVAFAVVALVLFAIMTVGSAEVIEVSGWLEVLLVSRLVNAIILVGVSVVAWTVARRAFAPVLTGSDDTIASGRPSSRVLATILLAGLLDVAGLIVFAYGLEYAPTWIVGLASSFGPAVTILVAVAFLGERLRGIQWLGLAGVAVGMVAIGLP